MATTSGHDRVALVTALAMMAQAIAVLSCGPHPEQAPVTIALSAGAGIFGAAFFLSWAAEAVQVDVPASLSFAFLAFVAVLPEYAVDLYFAWQAGQDPVYTQYAMANMTGANRILIGIGWPLVLLAYAGRSRRSAIELSAGQRTELRFLLLATLYCFIVPLKGSLGLIDSGVLILIFVAYLRAAAGGEHVEPELAGPAASVARLPELKRRLATAAMFAAAALTIVWVAEPFAESLLAVGRGAGIDEFILVQWLAPLASEAPEFIVAVLFALQLKASAGFATLLSSKVNQWTLLVGALPIAFAVSSGDWAPMELDARQSSEILLTGAQSLFGVVLLARMRFTRPAALTLAALFIVQLSLPDPAIRAAFVWLYLGSALALVVVDGDRRRTLVSLVTGQTN